MPLSSTRAMYIHCFRSAREFCRAARFPQSFLSCALTPYFGPSRRKLLSQKLGRVGACADDIGIALAKLESIVVAQKCFQHFCNVSGTALSPKKCIMIL